MGTVLVVSLAPVSLVVVVSVNGVCAVRVVRSAPYSRIRGRAIILIVLIISAIAVTTAIVSTINVVWGPIIWAAPSVTLTDRDCDPRAIPPTSAVYRKPHLGFDWLTATQKKGDKSCYCD